MLIPDREEACEHIGRVLRRFSYWRLGKPDKGLVKRYLERTTGLSRAQLTRLVTRYLAAGEVGDRRRGAGRRFQREYRPEDIELLGETDELRGTLSGPATLAICKRAWEVFGDERFRRLAELSNGHLYNLRRSPGYVRVDSVHQGDLDQVKGVYHINLMDEVTQFQYLGSVERIAESFLLPVLEDLLAAFPFRIRGFHSDNGSLCWGQHSFPVIPSSE